MEHSLKLAGAGLLVTFVAGMVPGAKPVVAVANIAAAGLVAVAAVPAVVGAVTDRQRRLFALFAVAAGALLAGSVSSAALVAWDLEAAAPGVAVAVLVVVGIAASAGGFVAYTRGMADVATAAPPGVRERWDLCWYWTWRAGPAFLIAIGLSAIAMSAGWTVIQFGCLGIGFVAYLILLFQAVVAGGRTIDWIQTLVSDAH